MLLSIITRLAATGGESCRVSENAGFFSLPTWYKYLPGERDLIDPDKCIPVVKATDQIPAIGLGVVDILLYVAGLVAVGFVIYGGFLYMTSQGEPDRTAAAKNTILNAVIGMVIVLIGISIVSFLGRNFS